ncbi:Signal recognition particle receptor FtsY [Corynebacterium faecale]|nr:Signal recognition particle receptor FtsY [Corynebacterium faecale]
MCAEGKPATIEGMDTTFWIVGLVALLILVIIIVLIVGKKRGESKTVSFEKPAEEEKKQLTQQEKSGNYQAQGGFNFAPAQPDEQKEPVLRDDQKLTAPSPIIPAPIPTPEPAPEKEPLVVPEPPQQPESEATEETTPVNHPVEAKPEEKETDAFPVQEDALTPEPEVVEEEVVVVDEPDDVAVEPEAVPEELSVDAAAALAEAPEEPVEEPVEILAGPEEETPAESNAVQDEAVEAAEAAQVTAEFAEAAREQTPVPDVAPEPAPEPLDEIAPAAGRIGKLRGRLARSQNVFGKSVLGILTAGELDEDAWEDIEAMLIKADLGTTITMRVVDELRDKIAAHGVGSEAEARAMLRQTLIDACRPDLDRSIRAMPYEGKPAVVLVVGVNGTGKTTTTGKLARVLVSMGHKVLLGAADTFRAAAADQLETWGRRVGATTVRGAEGADPASVAFDAVARGVEQQADVVLVDTAGRLHTSTGLMDQLGKVKRVVEKKAPVDEVLLVLDATVGQNGMQQARIFRDVVDITGVVLTKLDGTAKGGIVFQVQEELGVPVKLVGLGEGADDLAPFEVEGFVDALLG